MQHRMIVPVMIVPVIIVPVMNDSYSIIIIIIEKVGSPRLRESDVHPISPKTPAPQYQPIDRKKRKGKSVENYSIGIEQLRPIKKHWPGS